MSYRIFFTNRFPRTIVWPHCPCVNRVDGTVRDSTTVVNGIRCRLRCVWRSRVRCVVGQFYRTFSVVKNIAILSIIAICLFVYKCKIIVCSCYTVYTGSAIIHIIDNSVQQHTYNNTSIRYCLNSNLPITSYFVCVSCELLNRSRCSTESLVK